MAYKIIWLPTAEKRFNEIIAYLEKEWTAKEIESLIRKTNAIAAILSVSPLTFRKSPGKKIHEVLVTKHNLLLYRVKGKQVELLTFFDTRQHPKKKLKK
ncbi:MAG: type II toxin-antitoxin system RelE/ParE family toxin [Bacteroidota bacterium]